MVRAIHDFELRELDEKGVFKGYASVFGVLDSYGTIFDKGCFKKTIKDHKGRFPVTWMHQRDLPIGVVHVVEDDHGLFVDEGVLDLDIEKGRDIYSGMKKGYITQMSHTFKSINKKSDDDGVTHYREVRLYEIAPVTANFAATENANITDVRMSPQALLDRLEAALAEGKAEWANNLFEKLRYSLNEYEDEELLEVRFVGSPRNPYGVHCSFGFKGGVAGYKKAWRIHFSQVGGGKVSAEASAPIRGTVRRVAMIAAAMKPPCTVVDSGKIGPRTGPKSPLSGTYPEKPGDYGLSTWKKPSDDDVDSEKALRFTCSDLNVVKRAATAEIKRRIADREKEKREGPELSMRPYPNEHSCRLRNPDDFESSSFYRMARKHIGKTYYILMGKLKGKSTRMEQAYHYPSGTWTVSSAKAHCKSHKGKEFHPATGTKSSFAYEMERLQALLREPPVGTLAGKPRSKPGDHLRECHKQIARIERVLKGGESR